MNRRDFLKQSFMGIVGVVIAPKVIGKLATQPLPKVAPMKIQDGTPIWGEIGIKILYTDRIIGEAMGRN